MSRRFRLTPLLFLASGGALAALVAGCSSDSDPAAAGGDAGTTPGVDGGGTTGGGDIWATFGIPDPNPPEKRYDEIASPYPEDAASCKAYKESAFPAVHDCNCDNCLALQRQCDALEGCKEIVECGISIGCKDVYSCYLLPSDAKCVPIVDKWGNTGLSAGTSLRLGDCAVAAGCR